MRHAYSIDEVFTIAEQIERNGARFYARAADLVQDPEVSAALHRLAEWEAGHETTFAGMRARAATAQSAGTWDPEGEAEAYLHAIAGDYVFRAKNHPADTITGKESAQEIYRLALQLEKDAIVFYQGLVGVMSDPDDRALLRALIAEEMSHVVFLVGQLGALSED
jgi:rubrerythrin